MEAPGVVDGAANLHRGRHAGIFLDRQDRRLGSFEDLRAEAVDRGIEPARRHDLADEAHALRALRTHRRGRVGDVHQPLCRDLAQERRHRNRRHDVLAEFRHLELRSIRSDREIGAGGDGAAEAERAAPDSGDDGDRAVAESAVAIEDRVAAAAHLKRFELRRGGTARGDASGAEVLAGAFEDHKPRARAGTLQQAAERADGSIVEGVSFIGAIERDGENVAVALVKNVAHGFAFLVAIAASSFAVEGLKSNSMTASMIR